MEDEVVGNRNLAEASPVTEQDKATLASQIQRMTVPDRIKLALRGNKEVRSILIRDSAKSVQISVINNPRITEMEIERFASSRTVDDEVLRLILNNRDWVKNYAIKVALVKNPRTPVKAALRFLPHLREKDLRDVARSKDLPNVVVVGGKKLLQERRK